MRCIWVPLRAFFPETVGYEVLTARVGAYLEGLRALGLSVDFFRRHLG